MSKTVFITNTSTGTGKAIAEYFSEQGWNVAATMSSPEKDNEVKKYPNTKVYQLDITDRLSIETAIALADSDFGKINVVVIDGGFSLEGVFEETSDEVIEKQFDTKVFGLMRITRSFIAYYGKKTGGSIIQVTALDGQLSFPLNNIYQACKWAFAGFTEALKPEVKAFNIKLKIIESGAIIKEFNDKGEKISMENTANGEYPNRIVATIFKAANVDN